MTFADIAIRNWLRIVVTFFRRQAFFWGRQPMRHKGAYGRLAPLFASRIRRAPFFWGMERDFSQSTQNFRHTKHVAKAVPNIF